MYIRKSISLGMLLDISLLEYVYKWIITDNLPVTNGDTAQYLSVIQCGDGDGQWWTHNDADTGDTADTG